MQRARATGGRGRTVGRQSGAGRKSGGGSRQSVSSSRLPSTETSSPEIQELLDLQREAGNQAVTYMIESPTLQLEGERGRPADADVGFNPMDRAHDLVRAIDQSDVKVTGSGGWSGSIVVADRRNLRRNVDFRAVVQALDGLTAAQVALVDAEYRRYEKRSLENDLLGPGKSGFPSDLSHAQRSRIAAMLGGTQAGEGEDPAAAKARRLEAAAAELNQLLYGKRSAEVVERVGVILRRSGEENAELTATYERLFVTRLAGDIMRLGVEHSGRVLALLGGYPVAADAMRLGRLRLRLSDIDSKLSEINPVDTTKRIQIALTYNPHLLRYDIERLQKERRKITGEIEQLVAATMDEGGAEQVRQMTLGNVEGLLEQVAGPLPATEGKAPAEARATAEVIRARISGNVPAQTAAELRRLQSTGKLNASALTQALRGLRDEAARDARRLHPEAEEHTLVAEARLLSDQYLADLRGAWDGLRSGDEPTFDQLLAKGNETERELNQALATEGRPDDVTELVLALRGGRKDLATVKRILADKHPDEIEELKKGYLAKTDRALDFDLFGNAPTRAGEGSVLALGGDRYVVGPDGSMRPAQLGKASGSDRLLLEDYMQRVEEGGWAEIRYLAGRAEREYAYTIENRGATGWWRDKWGNEARSLLDATIRDVREIKKQYAALVLPIGWGSLVLRPQMARTAEAGDLLQRIRLARATIRGDRSAYEEATAKLRATFQAVASFVLQAALTAILTPAAGALFAARGVAFARTALVTFVRTTSVGVASQVGANVAVYGSEYNAAMLKRDLLTGLGGAVGSAAAEKLAQAAFASVAKGMADRLGKRASDEIVKVASTVGSMEGSAVAEGKSLTADLTIQNVIEQYVLGKVAEGITEQTRKRLDLPADVSIDPDAYRRYERPGVAGEGHRGRVGPEQPPTSIDGDGLEPAEPSVPMALPEPTSAGAPGIHERFDVSDVVVGDQQPSGTGRATGARDQGSQPKVVPAAGSPAAGTKADRRRKAADDLRRAIEEAGRYPNDPPDSPLRQAAERQLVDAREAYRREYGRLPGEPPPLPESAAPDLWDATLVVQLPKANSYPEHYKLYSKMVVEDPSREVGLFKNSETGEYVVVRGDEDTTYVDVDPQTGEKRSLEGAGKAQRWKEVLNAQSDKGHWELVAHSHPGNATAEPVLKLPSGGNADFGVLVYASSQSGWQAKSSRINYRTEKGPRVTDFGFDPADPLPFWIKITGEPEIRFPTIERYHDYVKQTYGVDLGPIPTWVSSAGRRAVP